MIVLWGSCHNRNGLWECRRKSSLHSSGEVVSKAFTEKAALELDSKRNQACQMGRHEKDLADRGNCMNSSTEHKGRWCFWRIVNHGWKFSVGLSFLHIFLVNGIWAGFTEIKGSLTFWVGPFGPVQCFCCSYIWMCSRNRHVIGLCSSSPRVPVEVFLIEKSHMSRWAGIFGPPPISWPLWALNLCDWWSSQRELLAKVATSLAWWAGMFCWKSSITYCQFLLKPVTCPREAF